MIITVAEVNSLLQISGKDEAIEALIPSAEGQAIDYTKNPFHIPGQYVEGYQISFVASTKKIINLQGDFITNDYYNPVRFQAGLLIHVQNSVLNDGFFTISAAAAGELTLSADDTLFDEEAGSLIRIDLVKVNIGFKLALAKFIGFLLEGDKQNMQSESIGDYSYTRKADEQVMSSFFNGYRKIKVV